MKEKLQPLKRFGQNYLIDKNIINKIIREFDPKLSDVIIEIGPGTGALTSVLIDKVSKLTAVEIDKRVVEKLKEELPKVRIINEDFLKVKLSDITTSKQKVRIIGNIPYNITSPILFKLIEERSLISDAMLMVQYEVAKRITAKRGTKDYGILSVLMNYFAETKLCFKISPNVFYPKPKVFSAIIQIKFYDFLSTEIDDKLFIKTVKAAFGNRRKTLRNSLSNSIFRSKNSDLSNKLESLSHLLSKRAEDLSIQDFIELSKMIKEQS